MHFVTLFLLKNEELDNITLSEIVDDFCSRFCYCCGESTPKYEYWCDWFQIGGRWCDMLKATRGYVGERSWGNVEAEHIGNTYSVVEIKDLTEPIEADSIYAIATKSRIYHNPDDDDGNNDGNSVPKDSFHKLLEKINNKKINGVIAIVDCHD